MFRWYAPFGCRQIVHVDARKPCFILLERALEQSTKHAFGSPIVCRVDRFFLHALQRRFVSIVHSLVSPLDHLHSLDARAEELRLYVLRQGTQIEAVLEIP